MNKLIPITTAGGLGAAGVGGYSLWQLNQKVTFAEQYKNSLLKLEKTDSILTFKFTGLQNKTPKHPKLSEAARRFSETEIAKDLHVEGCEDIYSSPVDSSEYFDDFKQYCSKAIKDVVSNIIAVEKTDTGKWNPKLTLLRSHSESENGKLDDKLDALKKLLPASSSGSDNFDDNKRESLKQWCDGIKETLFISDEEIPLKQFKLYCA
ncbi:hypothetical protein HF1_07320 [Mycoplasma haemofelis str. Langford 1]|uniref:Uncharacterized protein n=1 Tax=Mycoplasma haemofelis (strain Langford 1) TaxID=941640 RepID=E8ZHW9_MYCHL|nr:hypothetical protein [Mycoplasma haemofelis]CBY92740.1 hypothetical protein HF1_07320 [Mycoplasma haemofelis str. Langford 1]